MCEEEVTEGAKEDALWGCFINYLHVFIYVQNELLIDMSATN